MTLAEREQGLIDLVETHQAEACRRLITEAEEAARALVQGAHGSARRRLHQRAVAERARARGRIEAARAERATRERRAIERLHWQLLEAAWPRLREALLERWRSPAGRRAWLDRAVREALGILPRKAWRVCHPPGLGAEEGARLQAELAPQIAGPLELAVAADLVAGVRIESGEAVLDATLEGLLADRRRLEARLLGLFNSGAGA